MVMIIALIMLTVLTLMVATTVHAILDTLEMASTAQVCSLHHRYVYVHAGMFISCLWTSVCHSGTVLFLFFRC